MSKFNEIRLEAVKGTGFKGFKDETLFIFEKGKNTFIGDNGLGKSSIGELIVWVMTGRSIEGKTRDLNFINKNSAVAEGSIKFMDEFGESHIIERKLNNATTIKYNGKRITQKQLEDIIPTEMFLLIFNPMYALSLDDGIFRKAINSLLPGVTKDEILAELDDKARAFLEKETFRIEDANSYLSNRRQKLKKIEDEVKFTKGYMAKLVQEIEIPAEKVFDEKKITEIESALEKVNEKKPELKNLSELLMKKSEFDKEIMELKGKCFENDKTKTDLLNRKSVLEQQVKFVEEKEYKQTDISKLQTEIALLRNDYTSFKNQRKALVNDWHALDKKQIHFHEGDNCPSCKQVITRQAVNVLNGELGKQVMQEKAKIDEKRVSFDKTLVELEGEGKVLLAEISKAKEEDDAKRKNFEEAKALKLKELTNELNEINIKLGNLLKVEESFNVAKAKEIQAVMQKINALNLNELEKENLMIQKQFSEAIRTERVVFQNQLAVIRKERDEVLMHNNRRKSLLKDSEKNKAEMLKKEKELKSYEELETKLNNEISHMKIFNAQKIAVMNRTLSKHLNDVSLKLEKAVQSTGEIKDCFEILYNDKELKICSTSETIKAGLEISHMMSELSGFKYPVFIDNGESITSYDTDVLQVIETKVSEGKKLCHIKDGKENEIAVKKLPETTSVTSIA